MLEPLGLSARTEAVYRALLAEPGWDLARLTAKMGLTETDVREALDELLEMTLLRPGPDPATFHPVSPYLGLTSLLTASQNQLLARQQQLDGAREAIAAIAADYSAGRRQPDETVLRHDSLDAVRERLEELAATAEHECLSLMRGGAIRPDAIEAGRHPNQVALARGVTIRSIFQDSYRNDPATLRYARWLAELGGHARTAALLPMRLVIVDRAIAMVPADPDDGRKGALELHSPGLVQPLCALFDQLWDHAAAFGEPVEPDVGGITATEQALLRLLDQGHTDEQASRQLGLSLRTVRRMMEGLHHRLGTQSRFQVGAHAARNGWL
jgi:DNA-binding CsgD family transcriptional regulator